MRIKHKSIEFLGEATSNFTIYNRKLPKTQLRRPDEGEGNRSIDKASPALNSRFR